MQNQGMIEGRKQWEDDQIEDYRGPIQAFAEIRQARYDWAKRVDPVAVAAFEARVEANIIRPLPEKHSLSDE